MVWALLFMVADLRADAHEVFANHVVAANAERVEELEAIVKGVKSVTERREMRKTIREAKSGKEILTPSQATYRNLVSRKTRRTNGPDLCAFSVRWREAKTGDLLWIEFTHTSEKISGNRVDSQTISSSEKFATIFEAADGYVLAHPITWDLGPQITQLVPTVDESLTIKIIDGNELNPRSGEITLEGHFYVAEVAPELLTIVLIDPFEVKRLAAEKIKTANAAQAGKQ
jgi:hypothetical protein